MPGRKPHFLAVVPKVPDAGPASSRAIDREREMQKTARKIARKLRPAAVENKPALCELWDEWATKLAHPTVNRLSPLDVYGVVQLCKTILLIEGIDRKIDEAAQQPGADEISVRFYKPGEGRAGNLIKSHPLVMQRERAEKSLWHYMGEFGLTPAANLRLKNLLLGPESQGELPLDGPAKKARDEIEKVSKYIR